jgi:hypothetical protein
MKTILTLAALFLSASLVSAADKPGKGDPEAAFKKLDANTDASVSKEEYLASKKAQKDTAKATKHFEKLDANKDGKLTKEEYVAGDKKGEAPAAPAKPEEKKPEVKKPAEAK